MQDGILNTLVAFVVCFKVQEGMGGAAEGFIDISLLYSNQIQEVVAGALESKIQLFTLEIKFH